VITLHTFGPFFGLPDPSPFVMKAETLLKMAQLPYRTDSGGFSKAPKGKLPYIEDDGTIIADSTFIRWHLEKKYRIDFDRGLDAAQKATGWAFEKMIEDNLYWGDRARPLDERREFSQRPDPIFRPGAGADPAARRGDDPAQGPRRALRPRPGTSLK